MEQIVIRNLPDGTKAALRARAVRHRSSAEAREMLTSCLPAEEVPMSALLAADSRHDVDFEPERLGLTARTPEL